VEVGYTGGSAVREVYRLAAVDIGYAGSTVRRYTLGYDNSPVTARSSSPPRSATTASAT
jgi:hypothetical protein